MVCSVSTARRFKVHPTLLASSMSNTKELQWLLRQCPTNPISGRLETAQQIARSLQFYAKNDGLPCTIGIFGRWGCGKTSLLALVAKELVPDTNATIVYFNAWKYATFADVLPAIVLKIAACHVAESDQDPDSTRANLMVSLCKMYGEKFSSWLETRVGVNPVKLVQDIKLANGDRPDQAIVAIATILGEYVNQLEKVQDDFKSILGRSTPGGADGRYTVVLIDELDRCDADEAFAVIKQLRALFSIDDVPLACVLAINPEPIGLAIKHRYGFDSGDQEYEARRILEKFVDSYVELCERPSLGDFVTQTWNDITSRAELPWVIAADRALIGPPIVEDIQQNATGLDAMHVGIGLYSNLRLLKRTLAFVYSVSTGDNELLWTRWHLELLRHLDPVRRKAVSVLSEEIARMALNGYSEIERLRPKKESGSLQIQSEKGRTFFAVYRSAFWDAAWSEFHKLELKAAAPKEGQRLAALRSFLVDHRFMDFLILLTCIDFAVPTGESLAQGPWPPEPGLKASFGKIEGKLLYLLSEY